MIIEDKYNTMLQTDIKSYFYDNGYAIKDILQCLTHLRNEYFLISYEDVLNASIEAYEINCPIEFLDTDYIVSSDNDFIEVGIDSQCEYLNIYALNEFGFEELLHDEIIEVAKTEFTVW